MPWASLWIQYNAIIYPGINALFEKKKPVIAGESIEIRLFRWCFFSFPVSLGKVDTKTSSFWKENFLMQ